MCVYVGLSVLAPVCARVCAYVQMKSTWISLHLFLICLKIKTFYFCVPNICLACCPLLNSKLPSQMTWVIYTQYESKTIQTNNLRIFSNCSKIDKRIEYNKSLILYMDDSTTPDCRKGNIYTICRLLDIRRRIENTSTFWRWTNFIPVPATIRFKDLLYHIRQELLFKSTLFGLSLTRQRHYHNV